MPQYKKLIKYLWECQDPECLQSSNRGGNSWLSGRQCSRSINQHKKKLHCSSTMIVKIIRLDTKGNKTEKLRVIK